MRPKLRMGFSKYALFMPAHLEAAGSHEGVQPQVLTPWVTGVTLPVTTTTQT